MLRSWRALGRMGGEIAGSTIEPWIIHDIRRTMRTGLSALPVPDLVRELVIAHTKPGLHKVYDQHAYLDEKRARSNCGRLGCAASSSRPRQCRQIAAVRSTCKSYTALGSAIGQNDGGIVSNQDLKDRCC